MLMLDMTLPIHGTGEIVSMDSGFCVLAGVLALHDKGVFGQALIKKWDRYWPKRVPGDDINNQFQSKKVGKCDCLQQEMEGKQFVIHCHKEDNYVCKIMSTHDAASKLRWRLGGSRATHWVEDVNNRRHAPIDLQDIWTTEWWPHCQFNFVYSIAEVNANNSVGRATG
ncbi:hypothetical protein ACHAW6_000071 [Cyclotella cf. meneghiniana]